MKVLLIKTWTLHRECNWLIVRIQRGFNSFPNTTTCSNISLIIWNQQKWRIIVTDYLSLSLYEYVWLWSCTVRVCVCCMCQCAHFVLSSDHTYTWQPANMWTNCSVQRQLSTQTSKPRESISFQRAESFKESMTVLQLLLQVHFYFI